MSIDYADIQDDFRRITLSGRLDIPGTEAIATKFAALAASAKRSVVVDLSTVDFLASIGIRSLILNAKSLQQRGGRMVLLTGTNEVVLKALQSTGIDSLIPTFKDPGEADRAALA